LYDDSLGGTSLTNLFLFEKYLKAYFQDTWMKHNKYTTLYIIAVFLALLVAGCTRPISVPTNTDTNTVDITPPPSSEVVQNGLCDKADCFLSEVTAPMYEALRQRLVVNDKRFAIYPNGFALADGERKVLVFGIKNDDLTDQTYTMRNTAEIKYFSTPDAKPQYITNWDINTGNNNIAFFTGAITVKSKQKEYYGLLIKMPFNAPDGDYEIKLTVAGKTGDFGTEKLYIHN
jgi:hypothetical protein